MPLPLPDNYFRLDDQSQLQLAISAEDRLGYGAGQTAAGTNQATALMIAGPQPLFELTTVASGTGVQLPVSSQGSRITICNNGSNTLQVYTNVNETNINGAGVVPQIGTTAGSTGVTLGNGVNAMFHCMTPGQWYRLAGS